MKAVPEHRKNDALKQLFRQLFDLQYKLERYNAERNDSDLSIAIERIDQILEELLESVDN